MNPEQFNQLLAQITKAQKVAPQPQSEWGAVVIAVVSALVGGVVLWKIFEKVWSSFQGDKAPAKSGGDGHDREGTIEDRGKFSILLEQREKTTEEISRLRSEVKEDMNSMENRLLNRIDSVNTTMTQYFQNKAS